MTSDMYVLIDAENIQKHRDHRVMEKPWGQEPCCFCPSRKVCS